jgi:hypothetical protein
LVGANLVQAWRGRYFETILSEEIASELKASSLEARLKDWTRVLTIAVVAACESQGWVVSARQHRFDGMPEAREEYLGIDAMAFEPSDDPWLFPIAAIELENSRRDDRIAYSLWKVLNVRAPFAVVFCYRPSADAGAALVRYLTQTVVKSMRLDRRVGLDSEILVTVGYRSQAETFPYGFFKWWRLNANTGEFEQF